MITSTILPAGHRRRLAALLGAWLAMLLTVWAGGSSAQQATALVSFDTPEQKALYTALTHEYRCLKCQNQTIADSNADLASDLRREVRQQVLAGKDRDQITEYLVARYGDFVLYRPPFKATTWLLWIGPFVLLGVALLYGLRLGKTNKAVSVDPGKVERARKLLDD